MIFISYYSIFLCVNYYIRVENFPQYQKLEISYKYLRDQCNVRFPHTKREMLNLEAFKKKSSEKFLQILSKYYDDMQVNIVT